MELVFELKSFRGPLDLLLHLIGNAKIDIRDIFVSEVTEQYIRIVGQSGIMDLEEASGFIQMAATLLLIKSRSMLPVLAVSEEGDPEEQLIRQLEEYAYYQQIAARMQGLEQAASRMFTKLPEEFPLKPVTYELEGLTLENLILAFARLSARQAENTGEEAVQQALILMDEHTVPRCMAEILRKLRKGSQRFSSLLSCAPTRSEVVTLFLALLELLKQGRLSARQEENSNYIILSRGSRGLSEA